MTRSEAEVIVERELIDAVLMVNPHGILAAAERVVSRLMDGWNLCTVPDDADV